MNNFLFSCIPNKFSNHTKYILKHIIFIFNMLFFMIPLTYLFNNWYFAIIASIVMNITQQFTYSFHCKNLDNCIIFTNCLFLAFGYIAKQSLDYLWIVFLICLFCIKDIYIKTPLKLIVKNKDEYWHKKMYAKCVFIFITIAIICLYLKLNIISSCIFYTFIMSDLILFLNPMKERL